MNDCKSQRLHSLDTASSQQYQILVVYFGIYRLTSNTFYGSYLAIHYNRRITRFVKYGNGECILTLIYISTCVEVVSSDRNYGMDYWMGQPRR